MFDLALPDAIQLNLTYGWGCESGSGFGDGVWDGDGVGDNMSDADMYPYNAVSAAAPMAPAKVPITLQSACTAWIAEVPARYTHVA
jgi:hypothetical protein